MAAPFIVDVGAPTAGQNDITPGFPAGYTAVADDVAVIGVESESDDIPQLPTGYTQIVSQAVVSGTVTKLTVFGRRLQAGDTAQLIAQGGGGNHMIGVVAIIRGCITTETPWVSVSNNELVSDASVPCPSIDTPVDECLVTNWFATGRDINSTAQATGWSNANLSGLTEVMDNWTAQGLGGGFAMAAGEMPTAGTTGVTSATVALSNFKALATIAFKPAAGPTTVQGTAAGDYSYAGSAAGTLAGIGSGDYSYAGAATGQAIVQGSAAGDYGWAGNGAGTVTVVGSAAGDYAYAGAASATLIGSASGDYGYIGAATGQVGVQGTAAGAYLYTGAAVASGVQGTAAGSYGYAGAAAGVQTETTRQYLRDTQVEPGTGGDVYDLATVQGVADTVAVAGITSETFAEVLRFQRTVGDALLGDSFPTSVDMASVDAGAEWRWRAQRIDSSGVVQASSGYSPTFTDAGIKTATLDLDTVWQAGDRLALSVELRVGQAPDAPTAATSITRDAGATVSFIPPVDTGSGPITHFVVTPYIGATPQTPTTVTEAAAGTIVGSNGETYRQVEVAGLTNSTAYTFTVIARNAAGDSPESTASGANTPLAGLVFGDDFNGPAGGPVDPEWWIYDRCGYLAQNEVQFYKPTHCVLDGSGNLKITAENISTSGPRYPSDPSYPGTINQPWRSGACQSNTKTWAPQSGNTMTFEARFQVCPDAGGTMWPGFFWLEGQLYLNAWKTDPLQEGWNSTDKAEIDIAEWFQTGDPSDYGNVTWGGGNDLFNVNTSIDFSAAMHVFSVQWKPGVRTRFLRDGGETHLYTGVEVPDSGAQFMLLLYLQILAGAATSPQSCYVDYVRVYDQNLG